VLVVMIGGAGSIAGPLIGALVVGLLPEVLASLEEYRLLFFGSLLLVVLWAAPGGIVGMWRSLLGRLGLRGAPVASAASIASVALAESAAPTVTATLAKPADGGSALLAAR